MIGKRPALLRTKENIRRAVSMRASGLTHLAISEAMGVSRKTVTTLLEMGQGNKSIAPKKSGLKRTYALPVPDSQIISVAWLMKPMGGRCK